MLYYAADQNHIFTFTTKTARDAYCNQVDMHVKPITQKQRLMFDTTKHPVYFLYNEHAGRYSVVSFTLKKKKGR